MAKFHLNCHLFIPDTFPQTDQSAQKVTVHLILLSTYIFFLKAWFLGMQLNLSSELTDWIFMGTEFLA